MTDSLCRKPKLADLFIPCGYCLFPLQSSLNSGNMEIFIKTGITLLKIVTGEGGGGGGGEEEQIVSFMFYSCANALLLTLKGPNNYCCR